MSGPASRGIAVAIGCAEVGPVARFHERLPGFEIVVAGEWPANVAEPSGLGLGPAGSGRRLRRLGGLTRAGREGGRACATVPGPVRRYETPARDGDRTMGIHGR